MQEPVISHEGACPVGSSRPRAEAHNMGRWESRGNVREDEKRRDVDNRNEKVQAYEHLRLVILGCVNIIYI